MNKKFVYQVGNNKKSYTMMHGQPNIKIFFLFVLCLKSDDTGNKFIYPVLGDLSHSIALP